MDALPVEEKTGFEFASTKKSDLNGDQVFVMHACGHDIHMSTWTGTVRSLVDLKNEWKGTFMVIAQQAEEYSRITSYNVCYTKLLRRMILILTLFC